MDAAGDTFIADSAANVIREVNHSTGLITTVAGDGSAGYSGDGGQATGAKLSDPQGVAVDGNGDLFIADTGNNIVREVNLSTGAISTIAGNGAPGYAGDGGQATDAELDCPCGLAVDTSGNLYIADSDNSVIREINLSAGMINTVAGDGGQGYWGDGEPATGAELDDPQGLAVDAFGNLFIADTGNDVIREVAPDGTISTVAGTGGDAGFSGDGGQATSAELNAPTGVAVDALGDLFVADSGNQVIRQVAPNGMIYTVAGTPGNVGYSGDGGPATGAALSAPQGVAVDPSGNLFIADTGNHVIREVANNTVMKVATSTLGASSTYGQDMTVTATLPADAAGYVTLYDGTAYLATKQLGVDNTNLSDALQFDGSGGYVDIPASNSLQVESAPFSIAAWIYPTANNLNTIFANSVDDEQGAVLSVDTEQGLITLSKAGQNVDQSVPYTFNLNTWYHIVAVQNFSAGAPSDVQFYVDGTLVGTYADTTLYLPSYGHDASIGWVGGDADSNFQGNIDELLVFDRALTQNDVDTLFNDNSGYYGSTTSGPCASGLVAGYHFDEGSGSTVQDFSGNGNDGTIEGNLTWGSGKVMSPQTVSFTVPGLDLTAGSHALVVSYSGDGTYPSCTIIADRQVNQAPTTTVANAEVDGQSLTVTATVSGLNPDDIPTGTVDFHYGKVDLGTATLDGDGIATIYPSSPIIFSGDITAVYSGDANFLGSQSTPFCPQITAPAELPTTTLLTLSPTAPMAGDPIQVTATVTTPAPGDTIPTGMVEFDFSYASSTQTFTFDVPLNSDGVATATLPWDSVPDGYDVTATYEGDAISASSSDEQWEQISGSSGGSPDAVGLLPGGGAAANPSGNSGASTPDAQVSRVISSQTTLTATATSINFGTSILLTADIVFASQVPYPNSSGGQTTPATLEFLDTAGGSPMVMAEVSLTASQIEGQSSISRTLSVGGLGPGPNSIYAEFSGFVVSAAIEVGPSQSDPVCVNVIGGGSATTISASPATINPGGTSVLTATVMETECATGTPTGTVAFYEQPASPGAGDTPIGTATLSDGVATLNVQPTSLGTYTYWAQYEGNTFVNESTSWSPAEVLVIAQGQSVEISAPDDAAFTPASRTSAGDPGEFLLTRSGNVSLPLTVDYTASGTAVQGQDYNLSGSATSATFLAGQTAIWIQVNPVWHALGTVGARNVTLSLDNSGNYVIGSSSTATATVTIEDSSIDNLAPSPLTDGSLDLPFDPLGIHYLSSSVSDNKVISCDVELTPPLPGYTVSQVAATLSVNGLSPSLKQTFNAPPNSVINSEGLYRFAFNVDTGGLSTGRYNWSMTLTEKYAGGATGPEVTYYGYTDVLNWSNTYFSSGWQLESLDQLVPHVNANGVSLVCGDGTMGFFWSTSNGTFRSEAGPFANYQLSYYGGVYTLTGTDGIQETFDASGRLTSVTDNDGNVTSYAYNTPDGALLEITDPENHTTKFEPLAGSTSLVGSVIDPSGPRLPWATPASS